LPQALTGARLRPPDFLHWSDSLWRGSGPAARATSSAQ